MTPVPIAHTGSYAITTLDQSLSARALSKAAIWSSSTTCTRNGSNTCTLRCLHAGTQSNILPMYSMPNSIKIRSSLAPEVSTDILRRITPRPLKILLRSLVFAGISPTKYHESLAPSRCYHGRRCEERGLTSRVLLASLISRLSPMHAMTFRPASSATWREAKK